MISYTFPSCVYHADLIGPQAIPELPRLMEARKRFAYGISVDHIENSVDPNVIAFIRAGKSSQEPGCVVVMSNKPQRTSVMALKGLRTIDK